MITRCKYLPREETTGTQGLCNVSETGMTKTSGQELKPGNSKKAGTQPEALAGSAAAKQT